MSFQRRITFGVTERGVPRDDMSQVYEFESIDDMALKLAGFAAAQSGVRVLSHVRTSPLYHKGLEPPAVPWGATADTYFYIKYIDHVE